MAKGADPFIERMFGSRDSEVVSKKEVIPVKDGREEIESVNSLSPKATKVVTAKDVQVAFYKLDMEEQMALICSMGRLLKRKCISSGRMGESKVLDRVVRELDSLVRDSDEQG